MVLVSCTGGDFKSKELALKEKELELKEREIALMERTANDQDLQTSEEIEMVDYKSYSPCNISIRLPVNFKMRPMYEETSPDYCDYTVSTADGSELIELHSLLNSRFKYTDIKGLYDAAIENSELHITYKTKKANWFVISGIDKQNGNIVYWKRIAGENFISDLHIEYPFNRKSEIEPYIATISQSFKSDD